MRADGVSRRPTSLDLHRAQDHGSRSPAARNRTAAMYCRKVQWTIPAALNRRIAGITAARSSTATPVAVAAAMNTAAARRLSRYASGVISRTTKGDRPTTTATNAPSHGGPRRILATKAAAASPTAAARATGRTAESLRGATPPRDERIERTTGSAGRPVFD